jgi:lipopolysaccharide export system protein LptA
MGSTPLAAAPLCPVPELVEFAPLDKSTPIEISADRAELTSAGDSVFTGGVVVQRGNQRLETEGATWNRAEGRILAVDGARFTQPGLEVESERLEYLSGR